MFERLIDILFGGAATEAASYESFFGPGEPPEVHTPSEDWHPPAQPLPSVDPDPEYPFNEWVSGPEARALDKNDGGTE